MSNYDCGTELLGKLEETEHIAQSITKNILSLPEENHSGVVEDIAEIVGKGTKGGSVIRKEVKSFLAT